MVKEGVGHKGGPKQSEGCVDKMPRLRDLVYHLENSACSVETDEFFEQNFKNR